MRQTSPSQASGASPFWARTRFVCSKARFSMSFGWIVAGDVEARLTGANEVIRRATGCDCWPRVNWQQARMSAESGSRRDIGSIQSRLDYQNHPTSFNDVFKNLARRRKAPRESHQENAATGCVVAPLREKSNTLAGRFFRESIERPQPRLPSGIAVDKHDDGDGSGPVGIALVAGHQRGDKPQRGYCSPEQRELKRGFF